MIQDDLLTLLEPTIEGMGYELADLEVKVGARDGVLRVFIDKADGIDLEDCEAVSRQVSAVLDVSDPMPGQYTLEVSSPGLDRRLSKADHFERFMGAEVRAKMRLPLDGRRNFRGAIVGVGGDTVDLEVDGQTYTLPIADIASARLVPSV